MNKPGSNITEALRRLRRMPHLAKITLLLWSLAAMTAIAGLLASESSLPNADATTRMAAATQASTLAGQLLVAKDELRDPRFVRSVIYITHHFFKA